ncbi:hypothetical protein [Methylocella sp.]|uniref:hypothetical protein n=1 Tax=Methylocella sp. TaxID=1978226 RepID=UPI0035ADE41A
MSMRAHIPPESRAPEIQNALARTIRHLGLSLDDAAVQSGLARAEIDKILAGEIPAVDDDRLLQALQNLAVLIP